MKLKKPLFYAGDDEELSTLIHQLIGQKYFLVRPTKFHLKIGPVNFFPTTGKITVDNEGPSNALGCDALILLLAQNYPPRKINAYARRSNSTVPPFASRQILPVDGSSASEAASSHISLDQLQDFD